MKNLVISVLILVVAGLGTAAMINFRPQPPSAPITESVTPVEVMTVQASDVVFTVASQGTMQPRTETTLVAEVSGVITEVSDKLFVGGFFQAGDVLLRLDRADYEVNVQQARSSLLSAEAQLAQEQAQAEQAARQWDLSGRPREQAPPIALREPFLKEAEARVLSAEAELQRAERQLERTAIRAPYDGLVREKLADIGQFVGTGSQVVRIFATDYAEVRLPLSDRDMAWLNLPRPGAPNTPAHASSSTASLAAQTTLPVEVTTPVKLYTSVSGTRHQWRGVITRTEGVVDSSSRMHYAIARIFDPYGLNARSESGSTEGSWNTSSRPPLAIGSFVNASLEGKRASNIFSLPHSALRDGNQVLIMDAEQRLRQREVNIVRSDPDGVYIDQGLNNNDQVIISSIQIPVDGMRVNPISTLPANR